MELSDREILTLASIAMRRGPVPSPTFDLLPEYHDAARALVEKGALEQVWQLSEAGEAALRKTDFRCFATSDQPQE